MASPAIQIERVSKRYELGERSSGFLSQDLERALRKPLRKLLRRPAEEAPAPDHAEPGTSDFWALRDVSLDIEPGSVLGLVGANGAGKSTLLKLLSRITLPTEGRIRLRGRVGTLLEVGTGFHPELTGRENVFLNGAILGMRRQEIIARFDEIVDFSGIGQFLDTPVKRYSSGMYVRLAFAVAAHLQPEILLVDEVLAVGDHKFQRKCLGKMDDVAREGRTVVFVSHNSAAVKRLCERTVWLDSGRIREDGPTQEVLHSYLTFASEGQGSGEVAVPGDVQRIGTGEAKLVRIAMRDSGGGAITSLRLGQPSRFSLTFQVSEPLEDVILELGVNSAEGVRAVTCLSTDDGHEPFRLEPGTHTIEVDLQMALLPGDYTITAGIHESHVRTYDYVEAVLGFAGLNVPHEETPEYPWPATRGMLRVPSRWSMPHAAALQGAPGEVVGEQ
jgi:lipopolysaccharide transport system ATP-binding protein